MKLYLSDLYRVEVHYPLDDVQNDMLYYLYQPIIGSNSIQLYMMLHVEGKRMARFLKPVSMSRLVSFLSLSLLDIEKGLRSLEAIGLLKTFVKYEQDITQYVYQLQSPLSLKAFFKNQILLSLLQESLSLEDFQRTIQYFQIHTEDLSQYEDITSHFQDVFTINHRKRNGRMLKIKENTKEVLQQDVVVNYDIELLYKCLADYQIHKSKLSKDDITYITQLAVVYSIDALTLAGMVKDAMESKGLNRQLLKTAIKKYFEMDQASSLKEVYHKQPLQYQTQQSQSSPLILHMKYLDKITPYDLLKEKQGGSEPVFHDLKIVETLMVQLGLKPAVVNVLIEYVLGKNNNRLSKSYCETIGSSFARKKIETAMDAYYELKNNRNDNNQVQVEHVLESEEKDDMELDEIEQLLSELKEGL